MNNILDIFRNIFKKKEPIQFLGVLGEQNSQNVFDFDEAVASAAKPIWIEKGISQWRTFSSQYQYTSSACVAFTVAKIAQILYFLKTNRKIKFSPGWIYKQRTPKVEGMWVDNAINIAGSGLPTEELYPSEGLTESQINNLPNLPFAGGVAKEFALSVNWIRLPLDFDTVASTIQTTQKGIMMWFDFGPGEWFDQPIPLIKGSKLPYRHSVCAVDAIRFNGRDYIVIEDSAELIPTYGHRKLISRSFFKRCILARYSLNFKYETTEVIRPKYDKTVISLQDCLRFGGYFPSNIPSTGYMGDITIQAIKDFQRANNIQQTGKVGPITTQKLVELFP